MILTRGGRSGNAASIARDGVHSLMVVYIKLKLFILLFIILRFEERYVEINVFFFNLFS